MENNEKILDGDVIMLAVSERKHGDQKQVKIRIQIGDKESGFLTSYPLNRVISNGDVINIDILELD